VEEERSRQEIAHSFLSASAQALTLWMDDVEHFADLEQAGKDNAGLLSSLSGKPSRGGGEGPALHDRGGLAPRAALLIVREIVALGRDIAAAVSAAMRHPSPEGQGFYEDRRAAPRNGRPLPQGSLRRALRRAGRP